MPSRTPNRRTVLKLTAAAGFMGTTSTNVTGATESEGGQNRTRATRLEEETIARLNGHVAKYDDPNTLHETIRRTTTHLDHTFTNSGYEDLRYLTSPEKAPSISDARYSIETEGINVTGVEYEGEPTAQIVVSERLDGDVINVYLYPEINHTFATIRDATDAYRHKGMIDASGTYHDDVSTQDGHTDWAPTLRCFGFPELHEWVCNDGNCEWEPQGICCVFRS